jgi:hypothetical protein
MKRRATGPRLCAERLGRIATHVDTPICNREALSPLKVSDRLNGCRVAGTSCWQAKGALNHFDVTRVICTTGTNRAADGDRCGCRYWSGRSRWRRRGARIGRGRGCASTSKQFRRCLKARVDSSINSEPICSLKVSDGFSGFGATYPVVTRGNRHIQRALNLFHVVFAVHTASTNRPIDRHAALPSQEVRMQELGGGGVNDSGRTG